MSVVPSVDTQNLTFEWLVPSGHIDHYFISYHSTSQQENESSKQILSNGTEGDKITVIISELKPGDLFKFKFYTESYGLRSEPYILEVRTSKTMLQLIFIFTLNTTNLFTPLFLQCLL